MALLHYLNIIEHRPDVLMERSVRGLKIFYDFLTLTKEFMESDASVMRLAWTLGSCPSDADSERHTKGGWVELIEPQDRSGETEAAFRAFLDENVNFVYEITIEDLWDTVVQNPSSRFKFAQVSESRFSTEILKPSKFASKGCLTKNHNWFSSQTLGRSNVNAEL